MVDRKSPRSRVLVVEDEPYVRDSLAEVLRSRGYEVDLEESVEGALRFLERAPVDVALTDLKLAGAGGLELVRRVREQFQDVPVIVLTGYGTIASAVECVRAGASDYLLKPVDPDVLEVAVDKALSTRSLRREVRHLRESGANSPSEGQAIGASPAWEKVLSVVRAAAPTDATILLLGESGTGKELAARMIHRLSRRSAAPYVGVNCAAVPLDMWESEFFGHRRGSFTGATGDREGRFLLAHSGTLFLDEVGTMPLAAQAKILRAVQDGEFHRLGDEKPTRVDVRIVSATNSDIDADVAAGRFRADLFYRLNVVRIEIPPLRDRAEDVPLLTAHFVREIAGRLGRQAPEIGEYVLRDLMAYAWPGNVRELRNVLERALILDPGPVLQSLDLPPVQGLAGSLETSPRETELALRVVLSWHEKELVSEALRRSAGVKKEAARLLGIDPRNLPYYLRKHGIEG